MSGNGGSAPRWLLGLGKALLYGFVSAVVLLALAIALSGPSQRERRDTARNVAKLVMESRKNRQILCIAIVRNPTDALHEDPDLLKLCGEVGVKPQARAEVPVPSPSEAPEPPEPAPAPSVPGPTSTPVTEAPTPSPVPSLPTPSLKTPCIPILTCEEET